MSAVDISIVIPSYNEEPNVALLYKKLTQVLRKMGKPYELVFVDDGSTDKTLPILKQLNAKDKHVRIVEFRGNYGQTAALDAGFKTARGKVIVATDADLQNDPEDIPRLIKKLNQGYDCVSGWRANRKDSFSKKAFSKFAGFLRRFIAEDKVHDSGCTLKAYRKECFENLTLMGEMHRFIPLILSMRGFRIGELKVRHHHRKYGQTKYGIKRIFRGFLDLLVVKFWMDYSVKPIHFFGGVGILSGIIGFITGLYLVVTKLFFGQSIGNRPLLILAVLLMIVGVQFIMFGFLADILMKVYYKEDVNYSIKKIH